MAGQSGLIVITKSSAASADGTVTGDVPFLYEQLISPKIEGETADEYDSRRLAKCQEALYKLYEGMLGKGGMFYGELLEAFLEHQAAGLLELPMSRVVAHLASQCEVLTRLSYDLPDMSDGLRSDENSYLTYTEHMHGTVVCVILRELVLRVVSSVIVKRENVVNDAHYRSYLERDEEFIDLLPC